MLSTHMVEINIPKISLTNKATASSHFMGDQKMGLHVVQQITAV